VATNRTTIATPPERVFAVLLDPENYADWVVGSDVIRDVDANWPAVGSRFHHRVGTGPLKVKDHTEVVEIAPPAKLVLHARARPLGTAMVTLLLTPTAGGTTVTIRETAGDALSHLAINPLTDWLVHLRNRESLRRLKRIAETGVVKA
jgi:uncharacterized protein YndB with AHSA1/START domain